MAPGANPTMVTRNEYGERVTVVSYVAFGKYRVNGTINAAQHGPAHADLDS